MKTLIIIIASISWLLTSDAWSQNAKTTGTLTFNITGFADNSGQVIVELYFKGDKVPTKPSKHIKGKIVNKSAVVLVENLPFGDYAAIIVHDKNGNGIIDHKWGMPNEPLGYTNNWQLSLFSGMPSFDKLRFAFSPTKYKYNIVMNP